MESEGREKQSHSAIFCGGSISCSVCLEVVADRGERSIAKLKCGHHFHLDCIGSAFNAKGAMQCPNCRHVEHGRWLYANGCRPYEEFTVEDLTNNEYLYDVHYNEMPFGFPWCPYQGSFSRLSVSLEEAEPPSGAFLYGAKHLHCTDSFQGIQHEESCISTILSTVEMARFENSHCK